MNRFLLYINCLLLFHLSGLLLAQNIYKQMNDIESFKSRLAEGVESTLTITCDFKQEKQLVVLSETIFSKGQFYFKKENNIRWEYTEPFRYLIIIRDNQLYTRDDINHNQYDLQSNRLFKEMNRFIIGCIQGDILMNDKEYIIEYFETSDQYYVKLIPREERMSQMINELQIWFDKSDLTISTLKIVESGEDYTKIDFINKKLNLDIPLEKFTFK